MPTAWRIVKARYAEQAFDGEGARLYGGRWNSPGVRVVYASDSIALAALELLTQLNDATLLPKFVTIAAEFDAGLASELERPKLPRDWRSHPAPAELQQLGDGWVKRGCCTRSVATAARSGTCGRDWGSIPVMSAACCGRSSGRGWSGRSLRPTMAGFAGRR